MYSHQRRMLQSGFYTWLISLFLDVGKNRGWG